MGASILLVCCLATNRDELQHVAVAASNDFQKLSNRWTDDVPNLAEIFMLYLFAFLTELPKEIGDIHICSRSTAAIFTPLL